MELIIPKNLSAVEENWQKELANVVTNPMDLLTMLGLDVSRHQADIEARQLFPMRVPRPFVERMERGNWNDPLLRQVMTDAHEFEDKLGYSHDPLDEQENQTPGLLHKYRSRVLLILKGGCAINCRYCFRRHFPYQDNQMGRDRIEQALAYVRERPEINEIILSGGDPLMEKDHRLHWLMTQISQIQHVTRVRIHTRLPIVIPSRITTDLLLALKAANKPCIVVLHSNHANELDDAVRDACQRLKQSGIHLLNQAVLLKGVNDSLEAQVTLSETLFNCGVMPYYLHLLDKVKGASHFDLPESKAIDLIKQMMLELPGFLVPKLVREIGGEGSKTPIDLGL